MLDQVTSTLLNITQIAQATVVDDAEIVRRVRAGEPSAAALFVKKYQRALLGFLHGRCSISREDAEDMAQDIWARAIDDLHTPANEGGYAPERGSFYTFLIHRYAKFVAMQFVEAKRRRPTFSYSQTADDHDGADAAILAAHDDPESLLMCMEELQEKHAVLCQLFKLTFKYGGYPHQVLAFGYSKLIYGQFTQRGRETQTQSSRRRREIEGDSKRLDAEHGNLDLNSLEQNFWSAFKRVSQLDQKALDVMEKALAPTRERLKGTVAEMAGRNRAFLDHHARLADQIVGKTTVRDYYGVRGLNAITDWCDKVQNRVRERLGVPK